MKCYPEIKEKEEMRKIIGRYGLTGKQQVSGGVCGEGAQELGDRRGAQRTRLSWPPGCGGCSRPPPRSLPAALPLPLGAVHQHGGLFKGEVGTGCQSLKCLCAQTAG